MRRIGAVTQQELDDRQVATGTRQRQHRLIVVRRRTIDVSAATNEKLHGAHVSGTRRLHQRRTTAVRLTLLQQQQQVSSQQ